MKRIALRFTVSVLLLLTLSISIAAPCLGATGRAADTALAEIIQANIEKIRKMPDDGLLYTIDSNGGIIATAKPEYNLSAQMSQSMPSAAAYSSDEPFYLQPGYYGLPTDPLPADYTTGVGYMNFRIQGDWKYILHDEYLYDPNGDYIYDFITGQYILDTENGYYKKIEGSKIIEYLGSSSEVVIPPTLGSRNVVSLGQFIFNYATGESVTSIKLPDTLIYIDYGAFGYTSIKSLHIPASVRNMNLNPFVNASKLETVSFGEGSPYTCDTKVIYNAEMTYIVAFLDTFTEKTYTLPDTLNDFNFYSWSSGSGLSAVEKFALVNNMNFTVKDGVLFSADGRTLVAYPVGNPREAYTVPEGVEVVGSQNVYSYNNHLKEVTIPEGVTILNNVFGWSEWKYDFVDGVYQPIPTDAMIYNIPSTTQQIFEYGNRNMNGGFNVHEDNPNFTSQDGVLYNKDMTVLIAYPDRKTDELFEIPNTVTSLIQTGTSAFLNAIVSELKLPGSLEKVKPNDFMWMEALKAFYVDESNTQLAAPDGVLYSKDGKFLIAYPKLKQGESYEVPDGTVWADVRDNLQPLSVHLREVTFPDSIGVIGGYMNNTYSGQYQTELTIKGTNNYTRRWASYFGYNFVRTGATAVELERLEEETKEVLESLLDETTPLERETITKEQYYDVTGFIDLYDALPEEERESIPADTAQRIEEVRDAIAQINHNHDDVAITGADWNVRVNAAAIEKDDVTYATIENVAGRRNVILALYDIKLTKNDGTYNLPEGQKIEVTIAGDFSMYSEEARERIRIYHLKEDLQAEYIVPKTITDTEITFEVSTFSFFGITQTLDNISDDIYTGNMWLIPANASEQILLTHDGWTILNVLTNLENKEVIEWDEGGILVKPTEKPFYAIAKIQDSSGMMRYVGIEKPVSVNCGTYAGGNTWTIPSDYTGTAAILLEGWRVEKAWGDIENTEDGTSEITIECDADTIRIIAKLMSACGAVKYIGIEKGFAG